MAGRAVLWLKLAIFFGLLVIVVPMLVGGWLMWRRPLRVDAWMSRIALGQAGLTASQLESPAGGLTVWEGGTGPAMVLLHGAGDQAGAWARTVRPLLEEYRLLIPDLPGHWKSEPREGPLGVDQVLAGVEAVVDARCADERPVLVGNSLGAWVSFLYAREHPDRVARIVAVNGGPILEPDPKVNLFPSNRDEARETMRGLLGPNTPLPPGFVLDDVMRHARTGPAARIAETVADMGPYLLDGRLGEVTVPADLVWGDGDQLLTLDYANRMLEGLPAARLSVVKGCGHLPQRECPDRFLEVLQKVMAQPSPSPRLEPGPEEAEEAE
jgi:pimeloyl-ACP methyl ester carboxylesterase